MPVEPLGIEPVHMAHDPGEVAFRRSQTQMVVAPRQTVSKGFDVPQPMSFSQGIEKQLIARPAVKRRMSCPTAVHHVIHRPGILDSQRSRPEDDN